MKNFNKKFPQYRRDLELQTWVQEKLDQKEFEKCFWCKIKKVLTLYNKSV